MDYTFPYHSPLGGMTLSSDGEALTGLRFDGQRRFAETLSKERKENHLPIFAQTEQWLNIYFHGGIPDFTPELRIQQATAFRRAVWQILLSIPYGQVMTYGQIAAVLAKQRNRLMSAQAVGGALAYNPIALIIPCHRVVGADGRLTGYAGGIDKKRKLLELEKADVSKPFSPETERLLPKAGL